MSDPLLNVSRRDLVDACLVLWAEMGVDETKVILDEYPELADFLGHLHHTVEHERAMVHRNVWVERAITASVPTGQSPVDSGS